MPAVVLFAIMLQSASSSSGAGGAGPSAIDHDRAGGPYGGRPVRRGRWAGAAGAGRRRSGLQHEREQDDSGHEGSLGTGSEV